MRSHSLVRKAVELVRGPSAVPGLRGTVTSSNRVLQLQGLVGNQAVMRLMASDRTTGPHLQVQTVKPGTRAVNRLLAREPANVTTDPYWGTSSDSPYDLVDGPIVNPDPYRPAPHVEIDDPEAGDPMGEPDFLRVEWGEVVIEPGGQAPGEPRSLQEVWVGDHLTWTARYEASEPVVVDAMSSGGVDVGFDQGTGTVTFHATPLTAGSREIYAYFRSGTVSTSKPFAFRTVIDLEDFGLACSEALALVIERYGAASASAHRAALAYKKAYDHQGAALGGVARAERMTRDLLFSAALATLGGAAGGAAGVAVGKFLADLVALDTVKGALTDAAKDITKFAVRSVDKFTGSPPIDRDATLRVQSDDPFSFLTWFGAELEGEKGRVAGMLRVVIAAARRARSEGQGGPIDEDPTGIVENDTVLSAVAEGMADEWTWHLKDLWAWWLRSFSFRIVEEQSVHPGGGETIISVRGEVYGRLLAAVTEAAEICGESAESWLDEFAGPLREKLRIEARREAEERGITFHDPWAGSRPGQPPRPGPPI